MKVFDLYIFRNLALATLFIALTLAVVIFLTQSLRFLELVINSGASSLSFWLLTMLTMPRFFEIILPLALMAAVIFVYNRMAMDSELTAIRSAGHSAFALARPALQLAMVVTVLLLAVTMYVAPKSLSGMQEMREIIKNSFSVLLFREGVFNEIGKGLTVYMRDRSDNGELNGLMIYDTRDKKAAPATVLAKRGVIVTRDDGHQVVVYDGSRQSYKPETGTLQRLNFERYTIDLPESSPMPTRWREPEERTILELMDPAVRAELKDKSRRDFDIEIHRRLAAPFLALVFCVISCCTLLLGPTDRRGQTMRIVLAIGLAVVIEGLFMAGLSLARQSAWGLALMYVLIALPLGCGLFLLSPRSDAFRNSLLQVRGRFA